MTEADDIRVLFLAAQIRLIGRKLDLKQVTVGDKDGFAADCHGLRVGQITAPVAVAADCDDFLVGKGMLQILHLRSAVAAVDDHFGVRLLLDSLHHGAVIAVSVGKN